MLVDCLVNLSICLLYDVSFDFLVMHPFDFLVNVSIWLLYDVSIDFLMMCPFDFWVMCHLTSW